MNFILYENYIFWNWFRDFQSNVLYDSSGIFILFMHPWKWKSISSTRGYDFWKCAINWTDRFTFYSTNSVTNHSITSELPHYPCNTFILLRDLRVAYISRLHQFSNQFFFFRKSWLKAASLFLWTNLSLKEPRF